MTRPLGLAGLAALLASTSAFAADAYTYVGSLGGAEIVLELTAPSDGPVLARYTRHAVGVDVPLRPLGTEGDGLVLSEGSPGEDEPVWMIKGAVGSPDLAGERLMAGEMRGTDFSLILVGTRPYHRDSLDPYERFVRLPEGHIGWDNTPYEAAKIRGHYDGEPWSRSGGTYTMVSDPRTAFTFPRVVTLHDDISPDPINDLLRQEHWQIGLEALDCLARTGSLGGYEDLSVTVHQLSTEIMSMTWSAAVTCGSLSISIIKEHHNMDVVAGKPLDMSRIFAGWEAGPSPALTDYVRERVEEEYWQDGECDPGTDLSRHLAVTFAEAEPQAVQFHLVGMSPPCNDRVLTQMITELRPFLAEGALEFLKG